MTLGSIVIEQATPTARAMDPKLLGLLRPELARDSASAMVPQGGTGH